VFDHNDEVKGVLTVMGDPKKFKSEEQRAVGSQIAVVAAELSRRLGWRMKRGR
jgi:DNA-binding IclR family transcriptional regulator